MHDVPDLSFDDFLARREARRQRALALAGRVRRGEVGGEPLLPALSGGDDALWALLRKHPPRPSPRDLATTLAPPEALPRPPSEGPRAPHLHRVALHGLVDGLAGAPDDPLAWALAELDEAREDLRHRHLSGWAPPPIARPRPGLAEGAWAAWLSGDPWGDGGALARLTTPPTRAAFRAVLLDRGLPEPAIRRALAEAQDAMEHHLLGDGEGLPAWLELAARALEQDARGPLAGLVEALPSGLWPLACACLAGRGSWSQTVAALVRLPRAPERATVLNAHLDGRLDAWLDLVRLHLAGRLLTRWAEGRSTSPAEQRRVLDHNLAALRGRLRAALALSPRPHLLERLLACEDLEARTVAAAGAHGWSWAWAELDRGLSFSGADCVTQPCAPPPEVAPLDEEEVQALEAWLLLVVARGRLAHLQRWVRSGGTGDQDSTWGRLLHDHLPPELRGGPRHARLRAALVLDLPELLEGLRPWISQAVEAAESHTNSDLRAALARAMAPHVVPPQRIPATTADHLRAALRALPVQGGDPWIP